MCFVYVSEQVLHQRLGQRGENRADHIQDQVIGSGMERSLPGLPQRERTMIGGDSQQEVSLLNEIPKMNTYYSQCSDIKTIILSLLVSPKALPNLIALQQEQNALNKALRAEQQLYSSLVRTVKEQDRYGSDNEINSHCYV